jgi:hypothetical protein
MRYAVQLVLGISVVAFIASCGLGSYEGRGNAAYQRSQKLAGPKKRLEMKMAYTMYQRALAEHPDKISPKLRTRFLELTLSRAMMVLDEGSVSSDAIPLFRNDIEKYLLRKDVPPKIRQDYALFLVQMADSFAVKERYQESLRYIDLAISYAADPVSLVKRKQDLVGKVSKENIEVAQAEYENGKQNKDDAEAPVRAEYYTLVALLFDSTNSDAAKLLSSLRKENIGTYSAYLKVIQNIADSNIFRKVNKYDILLALPSVAKGGNVSVEMNMYNYSFNPLRLKAEHFFLVDKDGKKYQAMPAKFSPELLDQEHEGKYKLTFPRPAGDIAKLVYDNPPHYTEKCFF